MASTRAPLRRPRMVLALLCAALLCACASPPPAAQRAAPATAGDCVEIGVRSNGFHTSVTLPAAILPPDHVLRELFPGAQWLMVGWGDEAFYSNPGGGTVLQGLAAIFPGGPVTVEAVALDFPPEQSFTEGTMIRAGISAEGAAALARYLEGEMVRDESGAAMIAAPGHYPGRSHFLRGRGEFHLFNNCNHWAGRALQSAGLDAPAAPLAGMVTGRLSRVAVRCFDLN